MPIRKLISNSTADTTFFNMLSKFDNMVEKDLSAGKVTLLDREGSSIRIDLADVFIFNSLIIEYGDDQSGDLNKVSYKTASAYQLHSLIVYLSSKFPHLIFNDQNEICDAIITMSRKVTHRRLAEIAGKSHHIFYVEESADNQYVNIVCDSDCYMKIDLLDRRFLILYKGKIGLGSLHFLPSNYKPEVLEHLNIMFDHLDISKQMDYEGLVGYE